jgi:hypothetical protein
LQLASGGDEKTTEISVPYSSLLGDEKTTEIPETSASSIFRKKKKKKKRRSKNDYTPASGRSIKEALGLVPRRPPRARQGERML